MSGANAGGSKGINKSGTFKKILTLFRAEKYNIIKRYFTFIY